MADAGSTAAREERTGARLREAVLLLLPLALLPAALFGLSRTEDRFRYPEAPRETWRLVVTTPQWKGIRVEMEDGFRRWLWERERVGVDVTWLDQGGGSKTLQWIQEQFKRTPDGIGVDLLFGGGTDPYETLKAAGLLQRYDPPPAVLDGVALQIDGYPLVDPDRQWFGNCLTGFGIMVNHGVLARLPELRGIEVASWEDLADPRLAGWIVSADPRRSSSYHTYFEILLQAKGFHAGLALARRIGGNCSAYSQYSSEIPKIVAVGQGALAPTIDQYAFAQIAKLGPDVIGFVLPADGTLVNADAAGILKGAPDPAAARAFVDFLLSPQAGRLWMLEKGEPGGPVRYSLTRAAIRPALFAETAGHTLVRDDPFTRPAGFRYDYERARVRWEPLNDLLGALLIDTQSELREALAVRARLSGEAAAQADALIFADPLTEDGLAEMAVSDWKNDAFREATRNAWTDFARRNYRAAGALRGSTR